MFPIRHRSIFRSRYMALLWAAGILWLAYDVAAPPGTEDSGGNNLQATDATGAPVTKEDIEALESAINQL
jgi:hypothetical protein